MGCSSRRGLRHGSWLQEAPGEVVQAGCSGLCPRKQRQPVSGTEPVATTETCLLLQGSSTGPLFEKTPGPTILFPCLDSYSRPNSMPGLAPGSPWSMFGAPPLMCTYLGPKYGCHGHADLELRCGLRLPAKQLPYYFFLLSFCQSLRYATQSSPRYPG